MTCKNNGNQTSRAGLDMQGRRDGLLFWGAGWSAVSKRTARSWRPDSCSCRIYQRFLRFKGLAFSPTEETFYGRPSSPVARMKAARVLRLTVKIACRFLNTRDRTSCPQ